MDSKGLTSTSGVGPAVSVTRDRGRSAVAVAEDEVADFFLVVFLLAFFFAANSDVVDPVCEYRTPLMPRFGRCTEKASAEFAATPKSVRRSARRTALFDILQFLESLRFQVTNKSVSYFVVVVFIERRRGKGGGAAKMCLTSKILMALIKKRQNGG